MAEYQLTSTDIVTRTIDHASIPNDPDNRDRVEYNKWVAEGGVPDPYVEPPPLTPSVDIEDLVKRVKMLEEQVVGKKG